VSARCPGPCMICGRTEVLTWNRKTKRRAWVVVTDWLCPNCAHPQPARPLPSPMVQAMARKAAAEAQYNREVELTYQLRRAAAAVAAGEFMRPVI